MSVKSRHLLLLFYKISSQSMYFCQCCRILKMHLQYLAISFAQLPGLPCQSHSGDLSGDLSRSWTSDSLRGLNPDCRAVPSCSFELSVRSDVQCEALHCHVKGWQFSSLDCMVPHSRLHCNFCDCYPLVFSDELVAPSCSSLQCSWSAMSMFLPLKCFTQLLTLLAPMQASPYTPPSHLEMTPAKFPSFTRNSITACWQNMSVTALFSQCMWECKRFACTDFMFMLEGEDAANGPLMLIMIFLSTSS
jgi:hypothetical protein